jgi:rod shape determining protein RodA
LIFIIVGFVFYFGISLVDISWIENTSIIKILYVVIILLLIYVKFFGESIAGTNRWIDIGFFSLQPSEFGKIMIVILSAKIFASYNNKRDIPIDSLNKKKIKKNLTKFPKSNFISRILKGLVNEEQTVYLRTLGINLLLISPIIFLTLIQPSLGNAVISFSTWLIIAITLFPEQKKFLIFLSLGTLVISFYFMLLDINRVGNDLIISFRGWEYIDPWMIIIGLIVFIVLIYISKMRALNILLILIIFSGIFFSIFFTWNNILTNYQKNRVDTFLQGPESDPRGAGYQVIQSKIAIGSGMLTGRGFLQGSQSTLNILTQGFTDFVFATFAEQFGFVGATLLLILYLILILRIIKIAVESYNLFGKFLTLGVCLILMLHVFINIGMNLGKLPVTGIPLPLMSYGGSSILMVMIALGLVQSVNSSKKAVDIADNLMVTSRSQLIKS